ncbi:MAG: AroM family protein [Spirochaetes bacterium]|nr:AroM family protein [Spirochaetota bacterium]
MKIGAITIGQSPRVDITPEILEYMGNVEVIEAGGLDGLNKEDIAQFKPAQGDYVLISRLKDGSSAVFAERYILPRLQQCIYDLEEKGARLIVFYCTGEFPQFHSNVPLLFPDAMLKGAVPSLASDRSVIIVTPVPEQIEQSQAKWDCIPNVISIAASPYGAWEELEAAAESLRGTDAGLLVLDCMGYTKKMKALFAEKTGAQVVLSRTLMARLIGELVY